MKIVRLCAQLIDLFVAFGILVASFVLLRPVGGAFGAVCILLAALAAVTGVQLLFLREGQTVGKAFFGLRVVSTVPQRPVTVAILVQREVFCKLMSCYFLCLPMLCGQPGGHEEATQTAVVRVARQRQQNAGRV